MPVEIRELIIRAVVVPDEYEEDEPRSAAALDAAQQSELVQACVEQVLKIIRREKQR